MPRVSRADVPGRADFAGGADFAGRAVLVTGAGRGIGRAVAVELAARGADVAVTWFRHRATAEETADGVRELGRQALVLRAHVGDPRQCARAVAETVDGLGRLDVLVSNAASGVLRPLLATSGRAWDWALEVNARALLELARAAAPHLEAGGRGAIVSITGLGSQRVLAEYGALGVAKAAQEALVRGLAVELAPRGIRVNAVGAGVMDTDALRHFPSREAILAESDRRTPGGRRVTPEEVARVVAFLASPDAAAITGQVIWADAGYSIVA